MKKFFLFVLIFLSQNIISMEIYDAKTCEGLNIKLPQGFKPTFISPSAYIAISESDCPAHWKKQFSIIRIYNRELDAKQIADIYALRFFEEGKHVQIHREYEKKEKVFDTAGFVISLNCTHCNNRNELICLKVFYKKGLSVIVTYSFVMNDHDFKNINTVFKINDLKLVEEYVNKHIEIVDDVFIDKFLNLPQFNLRNTI